MGTSASAGQTTFTAAPKDLERQRLHSLVSEYCVSSLRWTRFWSFVHHSTLFGGVVLSGLATLSLAAKWPPESSKPDYNLVAIILAGCATLIGTLAATGGFATKWRANSEEYTGLQLLYIDAGDGNVTSDEIRTRLKKLISEADAQIVAASTVAATGGKPL